MPPVWAACIHEAGHCVVELALGNKVVEVWVDGEEGLCRSRTRGLFSAVGALAGPAAEWRLDRPGELPVPGDFASNMHLTDVQNAIERLGTDNGEELLACWIEAEALLAANWDAVLSIADSLRWHGSLSGGEAELSWRAAQRRAA